MIILSVLVISTLSHLKRICKTSGIYTTLKTLLKSPLATKNPHNPSSYIDLILTNRCKSFQNTKVINTGLSDFHKLTITVLKTSFKKLPPTIISCRDYKIYCPLTFRVELDVIFSFDLNLVCNDIFVNIFMEVFNKHAPIKFKYSRANNNPFMTKALRKAIMFRSKLRNKLNKTNTPEANLASGAIKFVHFPLNLRELWKSQSFSYL